MLSIVRYLVFCLTNHWHLVNAKTVTNRHRRNTIDNKIAYNFFFKIKSNGMYIKAYNVIICLLGIRGGE